MDLPIPCQQKLCTLAIPCYRVAANWSRTDFSLWPGARLWRPFKPLDVWRTANGPAS